MDDEREEPKDWIRTMTARSCIARLDLLNRLGVRVHHLSLDHDLGDEEVVGNGYQVLNWIEEQTFNNPDYTPPDIIHVHSSNAGARPKMTKAIESIMRIVGRRENS